MNHFYKIPTLFRMMLKRKPQAAKSTAFSDFIRNASSREKKRVYAIVLKKSTDKQNEVLGKNFDPATADCS